jgi:hypothetical protein
MKNVTNGNLTYVLAVVTASIFPGIKLDIFAAGHGDTLFLLNDGSTNA